MVGLLLSLEERLRGASPIPALPLEKLAGYYEHLAELAKGYEKDTSKLQENLRHVCSWRDEVAQLIKVIGE